jgi:hypothetical protein
VPHPASLCELRRTGPAPLRKSNRRSALCAHLERGNEFQRALAVCVLNKVPTEDMKVIQETFDHHVGPLGQAMSKS